MRYWRTTGSSSAAIKTGSTYICDNMRDITIVRANLLPGRVCRKWLHLWTTTGNSMHYGRWNRKYLYILNHERQDDNSNGKCGVFGQAQLGKADPERLRKRPTTGNENINVLVPSLQFLVVVRCRNHLATLLSRSSSSKIPNLSLEFRCYVSQFQRYNYFRFWEPYLDTSGCRSLLYSLVNTIFQVVDLWGNGCNHQSFFDRQLICFDR